MKTVVVFLILYSTFFHIEAQKILAIDVFTFGHFKRIRIAQNTVMVYKLKGTHHKQTHTLVDMEDSLLYIETGEAIKLSEIKKIIIDRSNFLTRGTAKFFKIAGIGYITIDAFNNITNMEPAIFKENAIIPGLILFTAGEIIHIANKKRIRIGGHRTLKVIDLSLS